MNFFIYAEICPYKDTGGGLKENVSTEKHYYGLFRDNRDISGLTLHKRQHDYTGNQGRQSSLCFGSPVPRQRTCKLWERGNWRLTTHFFFSLKSIQKQFDSKGSQYLRKFGKDKGNINDEAVFQHLLLLCFKCVLLGQMLWCEKVHENTRLCKVKKVKVQSAIFEWGRLSSTECEHKEYWQGKMVVARQDSGNGNCNIKK